MKVVLAKPCWDYPKGPSESTYNRVWPPLELANCAAILIRAGHEARIVDAQALGLSPFDLASHVEGADLVILTSTGLDRWQCPYNDPKPFAAAARAIENTGVKLAVTGFHGTVAPATVLGQTGADIVIRGEPEGAVADIAAGKPIADVAGVTFARAGQIVSNPVRPLLDLATLPTPAFELFDLTRYFYEILGDRFLLLEATRGCPYQCSFCAKAMYGGEFRRKTPEQMRLEIDHALKTTPVRTAYFIDLEFTVARDLAKEICLHLISRGSPLRWCCQTRADNLDEEMVDWMKGAGCRLVHIGVESGAAHVLERSGKGTSKDAILKGVRMLEKAGIETLAFFMFGLPGETDEDREETVRFAMELEPTYASFHFATPYPGSKLFEEAGLAIGDDMSFPLVLPDEKIEDLKVWVSNAVRRFYVRPWYIVRHLAKGGPSNWYRQLRLFVSYIR